MHYDLVVIVDGSISILSRSLEDGAERVITTHETGRFLGELSILTGERTTLAARAVYMILRFDPLFSEWYFMYSGIVRATYPIEGHDKELHSIT